MAEYIKISIITPSKEFYVGQIRMLHTKSLEGEIGILPNHMPLATVLQPTISEFIDEKNERKRFFSSSGALKVNEDEIVMLCDSCEWPEEIDTERAKRAKERAEKRLDEKKDIDIDRAKLALMRSLERIKIKELS